MRLSITRTAPTAGFGLVCPSAFLASFNAARMNCSSRFAMMVVTDQIIILGYF
jgi:hypothetical protein